MCRSSGSFRFVCVGSTLFPCSCLCLLYWVRLARGWFFLCVSNYRPAGHLLNSFIPLFVLETHVESSPTSHSLHWNTHTHTTPPPPSDSPPVWCTYEMKTNMGRGVNISKCWLHKKAASENSCRDLRARGFVCWPVQLQPSQGPSLLRVHWAWVQIAGWSLTSLTTDTRSAASRHTELPASVTESWETQWSKISCKPLWLTMNLNWILGGMRMS